LLGHSCLSGYFNLWQTGYPFIECAWQSRQTPYFAAFGDAILCDISVIIVMNDAFRESDTILFRKSVTFQTGFGIIADEPFNVGSLTTTGSFLNTYNQIRAYGGISGTGGFITTGQTGNFYPSSNRQ